jgi:hypothetical protein
MQERGFDALQSGAGPLLLVGSTILLVLIIIAGGLFMRMKEMEWRATHEKDGTPKKDDPATP